MIKKEEILKVAEESYYLTPKMIKFLLIENLALKTLLHDKGIFSVEEFDQKKNDAEKILNERTEDQIVSQFKNHLG